MMDISPVNIAIYRCSARDAAYHKRLLITRDTDKPRCYLWADCG
jgi:hypothetical protein